MTDLTAEQRANLKAKAEAAHPRGSCDGCRYCWIELELVPGLAALLAENERLRTALERGLFLIESLDPQLQPIDGDDGFIKGYRMNTGIWHKLLAWARDDHRVALREGRPA